jgi:tRNA pseudouridine65 synthase
MEPLHILYEDDFLIAIDKPAGMLVHANAKDDHPEWIAMKRLREQIGRRVFPIHRLDRPTSGVLLFALDKRTAGYLQQAFEQRKVTKTYLAIVSGIAPNQWRCDTALSDDSGATHRDAVTHFELIQTSPEAFFTSEPSLRLSLIKAMPETGRFHQIRRHLLACGFPIVGDFRYAGQDRSFALGELLGTGTRMLLQAKRLEITHPQSGERIIIEAPGDEGFRKCFPWH